MNMFSQEPSITRKSLFLSAAGLLSISSAYAQQINFVDATSANVLRYDGVAFVPTVGPNGGAADDNWHQRTNFGQGGFVYTAGEGAAEDTPMLLCTITGLTPGATYQTYGYFWANGASGNWRFKATNRPGAVRSGAWPSVDSLNQNILDDGTPLDLGDDFIDNDPFSSFSDDGSFSSTQALDLAGLDTDADGFSDSGFDIPVKVAQPNLTMKQATLGLAVADANGEIVIAVDDLRNQPTGFNRTWFDGVGYRLAVPGDAPVDTDGDGMIDEWEIRHGLDPSVDDSAADPDGDLLTNLQEYLGEDGVDSPAGNFDQSKPLVADTDGDGFNDVVEYGTGSSASDAATLPRGIMAQTEFYLLPWINRLGGAQSATASPLFANSGAYASVDTGALGNGVILSFANSNENLYSAPVYCMADFRVTGALNEAINILTGSTQNAQTSQQSQCVLRVNADGSLSYFNGVNFLQGAPAGTVVAGNTYSVRFRYDIANNSYQVTLLDRSNGDASLLPALAGVDLDTRTTTTAATLYFSIGMQNASPGGMQLDVDNMLVSIVDVAAGGSQAVIDQDGDTASDTWELEFLATMNHLGRAEDSDGDVMAQAWELQYFGNESQGALGDPDGDLIPNWLEYQNNTDPTVPNTLDGVLTHELWSGIEGDKVKDLRESAKFVQAPDIRNFVSITESPAYVMDHYGNRIRGYLLAPESGTYRFWASGDDQVELWLSTDEDKFNRKLLLRPGIRTGYREWDRDISQKSGPVDLVAGQRYYIEMWHKDSEDRNSLSVAWERPGGGARELVPSAYLRSYVAQSTDLDDDDLPDAWEIANGLDATDNGSGSSVNGYRGDLDGDGLLNYQEHEAGTRADIADTDGDGVNDYDEVQILKTSALAGDVAPFLSVQTVNGSAFTGELGGWSTNGNLAYGEGVRGWLEYQITVPSDGIYLLNLTMGPRTGGALSNDYEMIFSIDGHRLGRVALEAEEGATGSAKLLGPWLEAGTHTVRVFNDNALTFRRINIHSLEVLKAQGSDADSNGTPDWVDARMAAYNGFDNATTGSKVSPFCLEGRATYPGMISLQGGTPALTINPTAGNRWYADVPLSATADTSVDFKFENGGLVQQHSVTWLPTNLLNETTINLRQGDSLLLTAFTGATANGSDKVWLTIDGVTHYFKGKDPMETLFDVPGTHVIGVKHRTGNGNSASETLLDVTVVVTAPVTIESPVCMPGHLREWDVPALPAGAILELDDRLLVRETIALAGGVTRYLIETTAPETLYAQVRMGALGPVLSSFAVRGLVVRDAEDTSIHFVQDFEDGSYQVDMPVVISEIHSDIRINYDIFVGGVIFDTGGINKDYFSTDFDVLGQSLVTFIKTGLNGSACHRTSVWQGDKRIAFFF